MGWWKHGTRPQPSSNQRCQHQRLRYCGGIVLILLHSLLPRFFLKTATRACCSGTGSNSDTRRINPAAYTTSWKRRPSLTIAAMFDHLMPATRLDDCPSVPHHGDCSAEMMFDFTSSSKTQMLRTHAQTHIHRTTSDRRVSLLQGDTTIKTSANRRTKQTAFRYAEFALTKLSPALPKPPRSKFSGRC